MSTLKFYPALNVSSSEIVHSLYTQRVDKDGIEINISDNYVSTLFSDYKVISVHHWFIRIN